VQQIEYLFCRFHNYISMLCIKVCKMLTLLVCQLINNATDAVINNLRIRLRFSEDRSQKKPTGSAYALLYEHLIVFYTEHLYSALLEALRHGSHSLTCKEHQHSSDGASTE